MRNRMSARGVSLILVLLVTACGCVSQGRDGAAKTPAESESPSLGVTGNVGSTAALDSRNGFGDLTFGDDPTRNMKRAEEQDHELTTTYVRPGEKMQVGSATVSELRYVFFKDRLASVIIKTADVESSRALLEELRRAYGGTGPIDAPWQIWRGDRVVLSYGRDAGGKAKAVMWSRDEMAPLVEEQKARGKGG